MSDKYAAPPMPGATAARYNAALVKVLALPEVVARLHGFLMSVAPGTPAEQAQQLTHVTKARASLVQENGFVPQ